ncbi:MAG: nuclear transport factor 2 family protein [Acidobacteriaceae bacterium]
MAPVSASAYNVAMPNNSCEQTVAEYFAALRAMDVDRWVNTFAPDAISHDPVGTPPLHGHAALRDFLLGVLGLVTTIGLTEEHVFLNSNSAAVQWTGLAIGRNGAHAAFQGIDVIDCNEAGKIVHVRAFWDPGPLMKALQG